MKLAGGRCVFCVNRTRLSSLASRSRAVGLGERVLKKNQSTLREYRAENHSTRRCRELFITMFITSAVCFIVRALASRPRPCALALPVSEGRRTSPPAPGSGSAAARRSARRARQPGRSARWRRARSTHPVGPRAHRVKQSSTEARHRRASLHAACGRSLISRSEGRSGRRRWVRPVGWVCRSWCA
jgi:hypothetical protein